MQNRPHASVLGGSLAIGTSSAVRIAVNFVIAILVARLLGAEAKGHLSLLQQFPAITALLLGFGFESAHAYFVGRNRRRAEEAVADSMMLGLGVSVVGVPAALLVMRAFVPALAGVPTPILVVASGAVPLILLTSLLSGVLTGQGRVPAQAVAQVLAALIMLVLVVALTLSGHLTLGTIVLATIAGLLASTAVSLFATRAGKLPRPSPSRLAEQFTYARRSYVQSVTGYLEMRQDIVLLGILASAAGVGVYSVGVAFAELLYYAPHTIAAALTARSLQEGAASGAELTARVTRLLTAFMFASAVVLALFARPFVIAVFGPEFAEAATVILILAPGIVLWGMASQPTAYLATHGRLFPRVSTSTLLLNFGLNLVLIPQLGVRGAAIATAVSYVIGSAYIIRVFVKRTGTAWHELLIVRADDVRFAIAAARALRSPSA